MNIENHFAPIAALDLDPIKVKLMHKESGEGWPLAYADSVEFEYRRFLYLMKRFPNEQAAPLFDVDVFWHYHILDTMKYAADCQAVFGYFLHHFPYVGLRGEEDVKAHQRGGERMRELYEQTYTESYIRQAEPAHSVAAIQTAYSMPATKIAYSMPATKTAYSMPATKTAYSMPANPLATSVEEFASSAAGVTLGLLDGVEMGNFDASARAAAATFYSVRPTISRPV
jgi:hypothetical protein